MSSALYSTRLWWTEGRTGIAKRRGIVPEELTTRPPVMTALRIHSIEYAPEVRVAQVHEYGCAPRDMTPAEITECREFLLSLKGPVP